MTGVHWGANAHYKGGVNHQALAFTQREQKMDTACIIQARMPGTNDLTRNDGNLVATHHRKLTQRRTQCGASN